MELILWRHAEAEAGLDDLARALTPKGQKQAARMAIWLNERLPRQSRILTSPAKRAMQTVEALGRPFQIRPELSPLAGWEDMLRAAGWPGNGSESVLVVGHQPTLGETAARLLGAGVNPLSVRKGSVWWFANRQRIAGNEVVLRAMIAPELI